MSRRRTRGARPGAAAAVAAVILCAALLCAIPAAAQGTGSEPLPSDVFPDDGFLSPPPAKAPWRLDWGVTLSPAAVYAGGGTAPAPYLAAGASGAAWLRLSLPGDWLIYARARDALLLGLLPEAAAPVNHWELNAAYLQLNLARAGLSLTLGRKPFALGSGLVLSGYGDGLDAQLAAGPVLARAFGLYSGLLSPAFSPYALGAWDEANGARRYLAGWQLGLAIRGHELSLLGLYQGDFGLEVAEAYTSWYTGLQARGLALGGEYLVEWYLEDGYAPGGAAIDAFGGVCRFRAVLPAPTSPTISLQYALASGDPDRTSGSGSSGNAAGTDAAFQAFGRLSLGGALAPEFSNLHAASVEASFNPLEPSSLPVRNASLGLRYLYYAKYAPTGASGAAGAVEAQADVGHGLDLILRWSPFNDLSLSVDAGLFLPGAAFPAGTPMGYAVSGGVSLAF